MSIALRVVATILLAISMAVAAVAVVGDEIIPIWSSVTVFQLVPRAILLWLLLAIPLSMMPVFAGVYFGILSPLFFCMLFPLGFPFLALAFPEFCFIGMLTGILVSATWRYGRHDDVFEFYP